jgi:hypothetical protein
MPATCAPMSTTSSGSIVAVEPIVACTSPRSTGNRAKRARLLALLVESTKPRPRRRRPANASKTTSDLTMA